MRKLLAIVAVVLTALVALPAPAAQAFTRGKDCNVILHYDPRLNGEYEGLEVCVAINIHDLLGIREGWARATQSGPMINPGRLDIYVDYLKLLRNGNVKVQTNPDRWYTGAISEGEFVHSTDWLSKCYSNEGTYQVEFRFKVRWSNDHVTGPFLLKSNKWTPPHGGDCPI